MSISSLPRSPVSQVAGKPATARRGDVVLLLGAPGDEKLWRTALASQELSSVDANLTRGGLVSALRDEGRMAAASALIVDAPIIHAADLTIELLAARIARGFPGLSLFVRLPERTSISPAEQAWAVRNGLAALLPGSSAADWSASLAPALGYVSRSFGRPAVDMAKLDKFLRVLVAHGEEPRPGPVKDAFVAAYRLEMQQIDPSKTLRAMQERGGVAVSDRRYRGTSFRQCFVASEALDWLEEKLSLPRLTAIILGEYLRLTRRIHHVVREQAFADGHFFFRFGGEDARLEHVDLFDLERAMRGPRGLEVATRSYLGKSYPRTFVGTDAVDWLMARHRVSVGEAEAIGQRLIDLGVIHHVTDEHGFNDAHYFYRFRADELS